MIKLGIFLHSFEGQMKINIKIKANIQKYKNMSNLKIIYFEDLVNRSFLDMKNLNII